MDDLRSGVSLGRQAVQPGDEVQQLVAALVLEVPLDELGHPHDLVAERQLVAVGHQNGERAVLREQRDARGRLHGEAADDGLLRLLLAGQTELRQFVLEIRVELERLAGRVEALVEKRDELLTLQPLSLLAGRYGGRSEGHASPPFERVYQESVAELLIHRQNRGDVLRGARRNDSGYSTTCHK